jgi:hypothetical protein
MTNYPGVVPSPHTTPTTTTPVLDKEMDQQDKTSLQQDEDESTHSDMDEEQPRDDNVEDYDLEHKEEDYEGVEEEKVDDEEDAHEAESAVWSNADTEDIATPTSAVDVTMSSSTNPRQSLST